MSGTPATTTRTMDLGSGQPMTLWGHRGHIEITHGCVWLTEAGDGSDTFLSAGDRWQLTARPVTIGASAPAGLRLVGAVTGDRPALAHAWRRLLHAMQVQRQRLQFGPAEAPACR